jgi:hypothetical protein
MVHPTGEADYNYWDAFTRFYFEYLAAPSKYPTDYAYDDFVFYREEAAEPDEQVFSIAATIVPAEGPFDCAHGPEPVEGRVILTWFRNKGEDAVKHEVRYAFSDIHESGWDKAAPAPDGVVTPPGVGGYCGMVYQTTAIALQPGKTLYLGIRPQTGTAFSQISLPVPEK